MCHRAGHGAGARRDDGLALLPFFLVAFLQDNSVVMTILSYVPFSSPTAMPVRLFDGDAAPWEPFVALTVLALSAAHGRRSRIPEASSAFDILSALKLKDGDSLHAARGDRDSVRVGYRFAARCRHRCWSYLRSTVV